jgi:hypothetical protein
MHQMDKILFQSLAFTVMLFTLFSCTESKEVVTKIKNDVAAIENQFVQINYDLQSGKYSAIDRRDDKTCVSNAFFRINDVSSIDGYQFEAKEEGLTDELGSGKKLIITGTKTNAISLVFEIALYDEESFISLNAGLVNTSDIDLKIVEFSPLIGKAYEGFTFGNFKTLDGEVGKEPTLVGTADTLISRNNLLATFGEKGKAKRSLVIGGLSYNEFQKYASVEKQSGYLDIKLWADDPVGKLVDANASYIFRDKFYVDFCTDNRFEALEKYGFALRDANHVEIGGVDFPILNFWYCYIYMFGDSDFMNNSVGVIEKMQEIKNTGFLKYSNMGVRLEPDDYAVPNNQQGWWDDEHWQMYKGGQLLEPYETIEKWGAKVKETGGEPFIYSQTARRSEDYCVAFPEHCLFNNPFAERSTESPGNQWDVGPSGEHKYWAYDFTDPGFIEHMKAVYANLKNGGVRGIKFDYPFTGWAYDGGFEDKYATTTSAYRNIFKLAYEGLGADRDVQERIPPYGDVALGVVTTQRTEGDCDRVYPGRASKTGLRWYKNRVVANYDHDPINPYHTFPMDSRDGWRAALSLTYFNSGRMEIGKYFGEMTEQHLHDLSRTVPLLSTEKSPRPIDAFEGVEYPKVYDYAIDDSWHILYFYNYKIEDEIWPNTDMAYGWGRYPHFVPRKMLPETISVNFASATDDGGLALEKDKRYYVFDFWNWKLADKLAGNEELNQDLRPGETRVMAIHKVQNHPQFISTNRHLMQGFLDMEQLPQWNSSAKELSGISKVVEGDPYKIIIATNGFTVRDCFSESSDCTIEIFDEKSGLYELTILSGKNANEKWSIKFE